MSDNTTPAGPNPDNFTPNQNPHLAHQEFPHPPESSQPPASPNPIPPTGYPVNPGMNSTVVQAPSRFSATGIAALVTGALAIILAFIPIINGVAIVLALASIVLAIVALVTARKQSQSKVMPIIGLVLGGIALIISVLVMVFIMMMIGFAADHSGSETKAHSETSVTTPKPSNSAAGEEATEPGPFVDTTPRDIGEEVTLRSGLTVSVDKVDPNFVDQADHVYVLITVTYTNNGSDEIDYLVPNWSGRDSSENATSAEVPLLVGDSLSPLDAGVLAPGETVTGVIALGEGTTRAEYRSSIASEHPEASWWLQNPR